jgi:hypothetical protein
VVIDHRDAQALNGEHIYTRMRDLNAAARSAIYQGHLQASPHPTASTG